LEQKKLIVHVIDSLGIGGAEILLRNTIAILPEYDHAVVYLNGPEDIKSSFPPSVTFLFLNYTGPARLIPSIFRLRKFIKAAKPFLVHSHLLFANYVARLATPKSVPLVFSLHSVYGKDAFEKGKKALWLERITTHSYHSIIGVSNTVITDYLDWVRFKGKRFVLYNFLDKKYFQIKHTRNSRTDGLKCVAVGNLKELKNYHFLIEAFKQLKGDNIGLDIYGDGRLRKELQKEIDKHSLPIKLCGAVEDTAAVLPGYDLFLQASLHEGYGLTVMEALAVSLPVYISDIPVLHEVTEDAAHFFSLNSVDAFVSGIRQLKNDPALRYKDYSKSSAIAAKNASPEAYLQKLRKIYAEVGNRE
jgi:glycosyltransferase involved in cell wall biosynthesis